MKHEAGNLAHSASHQCARRAVLGKCSANEGFNAISGNEIGIELLSEHDQGLGNFLHRQCGGATAWVLCGNKELTRHLGLRTSRRVPVRNGPIECRWLKYEIRPSTPSTPSSDPVPPTGPEAPEA